MNYHQFFIDNLEDNSKFLDGGSEIGYMAYEVAEKPKKL